MNKKVEEQEEWAKGLNVLSDVLEGSLFCNFYWANDDIGFVALDQMCYFHPRERLRQLQGIIETTLALSDEEMEEIGAEEDARRKKYFTPKPVAKEPENGYVYLIKTGPLYKVGISQSPKDRLDKYRTENPFTVEVIACEFCKAYKIVEQAILTGWRDKVVKGNEWLDLTDDDASTIADAIKRQAVL